MKGKHTYRHVDASDTLPAALRVNPYRVPDGYFEDLSQHVLHRCRHIDDAQHTLAVPSGYFGQLEHDITARIAEQKLKEQVAETGFAIPDGYFGKLEEQLLAEQLLRNNVHDAGFTVPPHYFETLQRGTISRTDEAAETPIRKISRPRWMAYAAAACVALVISAIGLTRLVDDQGATSPLASVSDQEILHYLELYGTANDMIYISEQLDDFDERSIGEGLSEADIEAYLNHTL